LSDDGKLTNTQGEERDVFEVLWEIRGQGKLNKKIVGYVNKIYHQSST